jgi:hypothetical protein
VRPDQANSPACARPLDATPAVRAPVISRQCAPPTPARSASQRRIAFKMTFSVRLDA